MIREAILDDASTLHRIQRALSEPNPALLDYALGGAPLVLVSTADGEPAGYALVLFTGDRAYLAELAVAPTRRREGRASRLLTAVLARLDGDGFSALALSVHADNDAARRLYERFEFEPVGREPNYYDDGGDAILMSRPIAGRETD